MLDKLRKLRADHLKIQSGIEFYSYQEELSDSIIAALIENFSITANATPKQIENLKQFEGGAEISRQAGKTTTIGETVSFIETFLPKIFNRQIRIGIFAKQLDQAKLSYRIVRAGVRKAKAMMMITPEQEKFIAEEENARQLVLPDGSFVVVAPLSVISFIEGLALDLIIIDEGHEADDEIVDHSVRPMGKTTNAPVIWIGKAGTRLCRFRELGQKGKTKKYDFYAVAKERRQLYEKTGDARHLIYEQSVKSDIIEYGEDSDYIQREYFLKWQIGTGQFTTEEELNSLIGDHDITISQEGECYVGIDTAKHPDSTVVTVIQYKDKQRRLVNWMELRGENYEDQFNAIISFIDQYKVVAIGIDSTGQGDFMPDLFENRTIWMDEDTGLYRLKFSQNSKDLLYRNLKATIKQSLTALPKTSIKEMDRFRTQMLNLQQEYKGQFLSVKHPDDPNAHDDYPDSWALAEWAWARWNEESVGIATIEYDKKPKKEDVDDEITVATVGLEDSDW